MSKQDNLGEKKGVSKQDTQAYSNIDELRGARQGAKAIENEVNKFFNGEEIVIDGKIKPAKAIGRREVFYFGLAVPEKNIDTVYGKDAPQERYQDIPKFYKDHNGNLKDYDNARELKELAAKVTNAVAVVGENASNYYSFESKKKLAPLLLNVSQGGTRLFSENALSAIDAAIITSQEKNKDTGYIEVNLDVGYQKILDKLNKTLETYKELAEIVKKEPKIAYASDVAIVGDKPTAQDYHKILSNAIINQKVITGLDPSDKDFKTKLKSLDPKTLGTIELSFTNPSGSNLVLNTQIKGKDFKKLISSIDPKKLQEFDQKGDQRLWEREELLKAREEIQNNLEAKGIKTKAYFSKIKPSESEQGKENYQNQSIVEKSITEKKVNTESKNSSVAIDAGKLNIVSPEEAFKILKGREQNKEINQETPKKPVPATPSVTAKKPLPPIPGKKAADLAGELNNLWEKLEQQKPQTPKRPRPLTKEDLSELKSKNILAAENSGQVKQEQAGTNKEVDKSKVIMAAHRIGGKLDEKGLVSVTGKAGSVPNRKSTSGKDQHSL